MTRERRSKLRLVVGQADGAKTAGKREPSMPDLPPLKPRGEPIRQLSVPPATAEERLAVRRWRSEDIPDFTNSPAHATWDLQWRFMWAVDAVEPAVLESLMDDVLPSFLDLRCAPEGDGAGAGQVASEALMHWQSRWRLEVPWVRQIANATLVAWAALGAKVPDESLPVRWVDVPLVREPVEDLDLIRPPTWEAQWQSAQEFDRAVEEYKEKIKLVAIRRGATFRKAVRDRRAERTEIKQRLRMVALRVVSRWSYPRICSRLNKDGLGGQQLTINVDAVRQSVCAMCDQLRLPLPKER